MVHRCVYCGLSIWSHLVNVDGVWCGDGNLSGSFSDEERLEVLEVLGEVPPLEQGSMF